MIRIIVRREAPNLFRVNIGSRDYGTHRQPMLDVARILQREGVDPETPLAMRWANGSFDALRSTVGAAAALDVSDNRFIPHRARPAGASPAV